MVGRLWREGTVVPKADGETRLCYNGVGFIETLHLQTRRFFPQKRIHNCFVRSRVKLLHRSAHAGFGRGQMHVQETAKCRKGERKGLKVAQELS